MYYEYRSIELAVTSSLKIRLSDSANVKNVKDFQSWSSKQPEGCETCSTVPELSSSEDHGLNSSPR